MDSMYKNSLLSLIFPIQNIGSKSPSRWKIMITSFFVNLVIPNLVLSHSVILLKRNENDENLADLILAPLTCCVVYVIAETFFQDACDTWGKHIGTRVLSFCGFVLTFMGVASSSIIKSTIIYSINFGLFCGLGICLIMTQINFVLAEDFYAAEMGLIQILFDLGQSIGQFTVPYMILILFNLYGNKMGYLILSCVVVQLLPCVFFIKNNEQKIINKSSFQISKTSNENNVVQEIQLIELSSKREQLKDTETYCSEKIDELESNKVKNVKNYNINNNLAGLKFEKLPQIIEESEESECSEDFDPLSNQKHVNYGVQRYSQISDRFDDIIQKCDNSAYDAYNNIFDVSTSNDENQDLSLSNFKHKTLNNKSSTGCSPRCCRSYQMHKAMRKVRNFLDFVKDDIISPLKTSFRSWQFYIALLIKVCSTLIPISLCLLLPFMEKLIYPDKPLSDAIFTLTLHAFGWLCSLITSPWIICISKSKYKSFVIGESFISSVVFFAIMEAKTSFIILLSSFILGICHGCSSLTYKECIKDLIGVQKWKKIQGTLHNIGAIIMLCLIMWIRHLLRENKLRMCFGIFSTVKGLSCLVIGTIPFMNIIRKSSHYWPIF